MKWYYRWYIQYPIAWCITIVVLVWVFPPETKYDIPSNLGTGLFIVSLCVAALNHVVKKRKEKQQTVTK